LNIEATSFVHVYILVSNPTITIQRNVAENHERYWILLGNRVPLGRLKG